MLGGGIVTLATSVFAGDLPPSTLKSLVPKIHGAVFFVYGEHGQPAEQPANRSFYAAAHAPKQLWEVPGSGHIGGVDAQPREYERRVIAFFDRALAERTVDRDANGPTVRAVARAIRFVAVSEAPDPTFGRSDRAKRIAELERRLVDPLKPLARVAYNLRWSWIRRGGLVFAEIDPHRWRLAGRNPVRFLFELNYDRQLVVAQDPNIVQRVNWLAQRARLAAGPPPRAGRRVRRHGGLLLGRVRRAHLAARLLRRPRRARRRRAQGGERPRPARWSASGSSTAAATSSSGST